MITKNEQTNKIIVIWSCNYIKIQLIQNKIVIMVCTLSIISYYNLYYIQC